MGNIQFPQGTLAVSYVPACNAHDVCYGTCNTDKAACDRAFEETMKQACRTQYPPPPSEQADENWPRRSQCLSRAGLYGRLVKDHGHSAYEAAQKEACECCPLRPLPQTFNGTLTYHRKLGGPNTSILPHEVRVTAVVNLQKKAGSSSSYDLVRGTATLVQLSMENGITNCTCSASNVGGIVEPSTGAMQLSASDGQITGFSWGASFTVTTVCTGSTDPACANSAFPELITGSLSGLNPSCTNTTQVTFTDPRQLIGSWSTNCPVNPQLLGRIEENSWTLQGSN